MKDRLQDFLDRNLPLPGVAACSVRLADRRCVSRCYGEWFAAEQVEQAVNQLALAAAGLGPYGIKPTRLCWVFEHARVHVALRGDGACLAVLMENRPGIANPKMEELLEGFLRLAAP
jgi:hypothetical protein